MSGSGPIVFFDGVCGLCNATVDRLLRWDTNAVLRFAPLQGTTARERLPAAMVNDLGTFILLDDVGLHERSDAAWRVLHHLGGGWRALALIRYIPLPLRDAVYGLVARNRYRWFGRREACRLPTAQERARFLA